MNGGGGATKQCSLNNGPRFMLLIEFPLLPIIQMEWLVQLYLKHQYADT